MNITQDSQGSDMLQQDTGDSMGLLNMHPSGQPNDPNMMNSVETDNGVAGMMQDGGMATMDASDRDRSSSFSSDRPVITNVSPLYHQAQQHSAAMKAMNDSAGGMMASPITGGNTGMSAISTTPGLGYTPTNGTTMSVLSSTPIVGSGQRSYVTTAPNAYQVPVVSANRGNYNAATVIQGQQTYISGGMQQTFVPGGMPPSFSQHQHTSINYGAPSSSVSMKQGPPIIKYTPATTNTSGFMYPQQHLAQSSTSTKTGLLTHGTYYSTNPESPLSTSLVNSEMYTSRLHKTGSRTGRWVTNFEGHTVEGKLETGDLRVVGERIVEFEVKIPKKIVREEQWEKVILVPEKEIKEDIVEDVQVVREKIVEYAKMQQERVVEVPEIQYVERVVEVPERVIQEKLVHVPRIEVHERIIEVPRYVDQEKYVEVPEIEYKEIIIEKLVEVPEYREEIVVREVPVPQYVDKPVPEYVDVQQRVLVERNIPVPVAADTIWKMYLPKLKPKFTTERIPLYVPRFIEVPVPVELLTEARELEARQLAERVALIAQQPAISLCEVENVAAAIKSANFQANIENADFFDGVQRGWKAKSVHVKKADPYKRPHSSGTRSLASRTRDVRTARPPPLPAKTPSVKRPDRSSDVFQSLTQQKGPSSRRSSNRRPSAQDPNAVQQRRDQAIALLNNIQSGHV